MTRILTICILCVIFFFENCYSQNQNNLGRGQNLNVNNGQGTGRRPLQGNKRPSAQSLGMFGGQNSGQNGNPFVNRQNMQQGQSWGNTNNNNNGPSSMSRQFENSGHSNQSPNQINIEKLKLHLQKAQGMQRNAGKGSNKRNQGNGRNRGQNRGNSKGPNNFSASQSNGNMNANLNGNSRNAQSFQFRENQRNPNSNNLNQQSPNGPNPWNSNPSGNSNQWNSNPDHSNQRNSNPNRSNQRNSNGQSQWNSNPNGPSNIQQQQHKKQQPPTMPNNAMSHNKANTKKTTKGNMNKMKKPQAKNRNNMAKKNPQQKPPRGMNMKPKKVSPRKFYWKTIFPSGTAAEESAEVLYSTKLVLINSESAPAIDEFNKGGILMDFRRGMMAVRMDVIPGTNFPGMPFNGQRACFLMKNITTFDQAVKELHSRGKTKRNLEMGEMMHMTATVKQRLDGPAVRRRGGVFITRYCQDAINSNNVYLLLPEAPVEMSPKTFQISGLINAMEPLYPIPVNIGVEMTIDFGPPPTMTPAMNFNPSTPGWGRGWGNNGGWG
ncbi:GATA zinc finger domain-containing protein 14-like [Saccostrea echinata]|uniref:GATA zinc finger domain-containing protein 14-like n=1 Tax=Saccostrea echinata TaxID=191078 RepID=UPI002A803678|nr:GATA zinc finger domain-containing protein 14-like [Saccostrea echinata]